MKDLMQLKDKIKSQLDRETVAEIVAFNGDEVSRDWKLVNNKSICIRSNGYIKEFSNSSGFSYGDIFDWLQFSKGITLQESIYYVANLMDIKYD